jgi:hypothetical protein
MVALGVEDAISYLLICHRAYIEFTFICLSAPASAVCRDMGVFIYQSSSNSF